ncbi:MAG: DJ-1/PfpI family protein [Myxococcota bacterium]
MLVKKIGLLATPGCRLSDLVGVEAVLGANALTHRTLYVAESSARVRGRLGLELVPHATFADCPKLAVFVVGEQSPETLDDAATLAFVKRAAAQASFVIGISNGVQLLANAGVLEGKRVTADVDTLRRLQAHRVTAVESPTFVRDERFFTAGPSTGGIEAAFAVMKALTGDFVTKLAELTLEYNPERHFEGVEPSTPDERGLEVAVLTAPGTYLPDVIGAADTLGALPNLRFRYVWKKTKPVRCTLGPTVVPDTTLEECPQADVIILGANMPALCSDPDVLSFMQRQASAAKAVICVCAGSLIVGAAGLLDGHVATSNFHMTHMLERCGATPANRELASSDKYYSAGPAIGSYEAALMVIRDLYGEGAAAHVERHALEYSPTPLFGVGSPQLAGKFLTAVSRVALAPILPLFSHNLRRGYRASRREEPVALRDEKLVVRAPLR